LLVTVFGRILLILVAVALAALTYRYVERPFRRREFLASRPRLIAATAACLLGLMGCGELLRHTHGLLERLPQKSQQFARTGVTDTRCAHFHRAPDVPHKLLRIGTADVEPSLLVWGDSHSMVLIPALDELCVSAGIAARCALYPACPPLSGFRPSASSRAETKFNAAVIDYAKSPPVKAVLLGAFWSSYSVHPEFDESLKQTVDALRAAGKEVYFLKDVPNYRRDVVADLVLESWRGRDLRQLAFPLDDYESQNPHHRTCLPHLIERGVKVLDPIPYLCRGADTTAIPPFDGNGSFFGDANHLSAHGARTIRPVFVPMIEAVARSAATKPAAGPRMHAKSADLTSQRR
jgi:hypothetical protein